MHQEASDYRDILLMLAKASDNLLAPTNIKVKFDKKFDVARMSFTHAEKGFAFEVPVTSDWFEMDVLDHVNDALAASKAEARFIPLPSDDQSLLLAFVPPAVYEKAVQPKLIRGDRQYVKRLIACEAAPGLAFAWRPASAKAASGGDSVHVSVRCVEP